MASSLSTNSNNIVFFGSGPFGAIVLERLLQCHVPVVQVITQPDKPAGRKQHLQPTPVRVVAEQHHLPVNFELPTTNDDCVVGVVVDYGRIIPERVIRLFPKGILNIHPSLLPRWRGASPIQAALLAGDTVTGVSVIVISSELDAGPILSQQEIQIHFNASTPELMAVLGQLGADLLTRDLPTYCSGHKIPQPQMSTGATYCSKIRKEAGAIGPQDPAEEIWRKYRALQPWPGVYCLWQGKRIRLIDLEYNVLFNKIEITTVQPEGKKVMPFQAFLAGHSDFSLTSIDPVSAETV